MSYRVRREMFRLASEIATREAQAQAIRQSSRVFTERFAELTLSEKELWVEVQSTAETVKKLGTSAQRNGLNALKEEIDAFLTKSFLAANLQECDIVTQNKHLTQALLGQYPLMQKSIAELEAQKFCHNKILQP